MGDTLRAFVVRKIAEAGFVERPVPGPRPLVGDQTARVSADVR